MAHSCCQDNFSFDGWRLMAKEVIVLSPPRMRFDTSAGIGEGKALQLTGLYTGEQVVVPFQWTDKEGSWELQGVGYRAPQA